MRNAENKRIITEYLKKNISKGYTPETLKWALVKQGYSRGIIETSMEQAQKELAEKAPKLSEKPVIKYEVITDDENQEAVNVPWWKKFFRFFGA